MEKMCACGLPLHYRDQELQAVVEQMIADAGDPNVTVDAGGRRWRVPRHYIALHGLRAYDLPRLGFPEVKEEK